MSHFDVTNSSKTSPTQRVRVIQTSRTQWFTHTRHEVNYLHTHIYTHIFTYTGSKFGTQHLAVHVRWRGSYISAKEPQCFTKGSQFSAKELHISVIVLYISGKKLSWRCTFGGEVSKPLSSFAKKPHISATEPQTSAKEPNIFEKRPIYPQKSPIFPQKSPMCAKKSHVAIHVWRRGVKWAPYLRKRALSFHKRALCLRKRALYFNERALNLCKQAT